VVAAIWGALAVDSTRRFACGLSTVQHKDHVGSSQSAETITERGQGAGSWSLRGEPRMITRGDSRRFPLSHWPFTRFQGSHLMTMEQDLESLLPNYRLVIALPVFWGDQDAFGHVNNNAYFRWFESARIDYSERIGLLDLFRSQRIGPILASIACDYRRQIVFPDTVHVGVRVSRIGRTSLGLEHAIVSQSQMAVAAEGTSTIVVFDYRSNKPHAIPADLRQAIEALEGRSFH
jgi:acyl-CoA thioester hydrolase